MNISLPNALKYKQFKILNPICSLKSNFPTSPIIYITWIVLVNKNWLIKKNYNKYYYFIFIIIIFLPFLHFLNGPYYYKYIDFLELKNQLIFHRKPFIFVNVFTLKIYTMWILLIYKDYNNYYSFFSILIIILQLCHHIIIFQ